MIGRADSVLTKTALISGASDLYSNHFSLLAEHFHDVSAAYTAVEKARGRGIAELLLSGRDTSPKALAMEREIAQLRLRLMNPSNSSEDIHQIRNAMFLAEESRAVASRCHDSVYNKLQACRYQSRSVKPCSVRSHP